MTERLASGLTVVLALVMGVTQIASCVGDCDSNSLEPVESGEYVLIEPFGPLRPGYDDLVGAQLIIDRDASTSIIRYTREGTTYEVRHTLDAL